MGDIQISSEYVVAAVRILHKRTGRKVSIIGHSQGALEGRWAARWWPDVRRSIDDLIMLAGPNHGLAGFQSFCAGAACSPAIQQMREGSMFLSSLNLGSEVPAGVSVISIYSDPDEYVQQATGPGASAARRLSAGDLVVHVQGPPLWAQARGERAAHVRHRLQPSRIQGAHAHHRLRPQLAPP